MNVPHTEHFNIDTDEMMACPCCGVGGASMALLIVLEHLRAHFGKPVYFNSCARCSKHNPSVGGSKRSEHLVTPEDPFADAGDIVVKDVTPTSVYLHLKSLPYANLLGLGKYRTFTHVDVRGYGARWVG